MRVKGRVQEVDSYCVAEVFSATDSGFVFRRVLICNAYCVGVRFSPAAAYCFGCAFRRFPAGPNAYGLHHKRDRVFGAPRPFLPLAETSNKFCGFSAAACSRRIFENSILRSINSRMARCATG